MPSNLALAFGALLGGAIILDYGTKNLSGAFSSATGNGGTTAASTPTGSGGKTYGQITYADVAAIGAKHGWSDQEIQVWFNSLIPSESNGTLTDTNPKSGAYGIAQGITGKRWYAANGGNADTVTGQLTAMANYIQGRYKTPSAAWAFHKQHNWY